MSDSKYGPISFLEGSWESDGWTGENQAPDPDRKVENTKFKQQMIFIPIIDAENHEQFLSGFRYSTTAWEEGDDEPFHEEVGYWLWDAAASQVMKCFTIPRGMAVIAGGTVSAGATAFDLRAELGDPTYGICSNKFLDKQFQTVRYDLKIKKISDRAFSYDENTQMKIPGQDRIFDHTEKNLLRRTVR